MTLYRLCFAVHVKEILTRQHGKKKSCVMKKKLYGCLGDKVCASRGCETAMTPRTGFWWLIFRECGELLCGKMFISQLSDLFT